METKKGITTIKKMLATFADIVGTIDHALEDKKINVVEGVKIALKSTALIKVVKTIKEAKAELMDLDGAEKAEIKTYFIEVFDLRNDDAEKAVESVVTLAIQMSDNLTLFGSFKASE